MYIVRYVRHTLIFIDSERWWIIFFHPAFDPMNFCIYRMWFLPFRMSGESLAFFFYFLFAYIYIYIYISPSFHISKHARGEVINGGRFLELVL